MNKKGFTLIELLVVIAIIGILSGIFMLSLQGARKKAKDARIVAALSQVRVRAETLYDGDYSDVTTSDPEISKLEADILKQGGQLTLVKNTDNSAWCAYSPLNTGGKYYCVDSSGKAGFIDSSPSSSCSGTATVPQCPDTVQ